MDRSPSLTTYPALRDTILQVLQEGKERARQAVEREKVRTYWEVGRILGTHLLESGGRADYGEQVVSRLASDIGISDRKLWEAIQVHKCFRILLTSTELTWSHYVALLPVSSKAERDFYVREADRNGWSVRELRSQIRSGAHRRALEEPGQPKQASASRGLTPRRGRLYTYRLIRPSVSLWPRLQIDQGFEKHGRKALSPPPNADHGTVVESVPDRRFASGYRLVAGTATRADCYAYPAAVERVVDGDTLWVWLDIGFGDTARQDLRLRGIDAPEMATPEGKACRRFVRETLDACDRAVVSTTRPDKYGRYLADLFYLPGETDFEAIRAEGRFLNQQLLDEGLAKRYGNRAPRSPGEAP